MKLKTNSIYDPPNEELANALTHGVGVVLCLLGSTALLIKAYEHNDFWRVFSAYVFGGSLTLLYFSSTLYHALTTPRLKAFFQILDHAAIFLLIAGTYTPFLLVALRDEVHIAFIFTMWTIAAIGIVYKLLMIKKYKLISTIIYLAMGWMAIIEIKAFYLNLPVPALLWILAGGLFYTIGTIFYSRESMNYNHTLWHIFVLCGSSSHFVAIYLFVY